MQQGNERPTPSLAKKIYSHRQQNTNIALLIDKKNLLSSSPPRLHFNPSESLESFPFQNKKASPFIKRLNSNFSNGIILRIISRLIFSKKRVLQIDLFLLKMRISLR